MILLAHCKAAATMQSVLGLARFVKQIVRRLSGADYGQHDKPRSKSKPWIVLSVGFPSVPLHERDPESRESGTPRF